MIEFKTKDNLTVFIDLDSIYSVEQVDHVVGSETIDGDKKELSYVNWLVRTKHHCYEVDEQTALEIVDLKDAGLNEPLDVETEEKLRMMAEQDGTILDSVEDKLEEEDLEDWQKDPNHWKDNDGDVHA